MAVLADAVRLALWAEFMRLNTEPVSISKVDLRAAVNAIDDFLDTNASALNTAIPQPARGALSTAQKARLTMLVTAHRFGG